MSIEFMNTPISSRQITFSTLLDMVDYEIERIEIVTAYWSKHTITELMNALNKSNSNTPKISLYINQPTNDEDLKSLEFIEKKYKQNLQRARETYKSSGIWCFINKFVHIKAYHIMGCNKAKLIIGSANLTERAQSLNEEVLLVLEYNPKQPSKNRNIARQLSIYLDNYHDIREESLRKGRLSGIARLSELRSTQMNLRPRDLRSYLLQGVLWYELTTNDPYSISLVLPTVHRETLSRRFSNRYGIIRSVTQGNLSVKDLLETHCSSTDSNTLNNLKRAKGKESWKRFTLPTSLGFWSPKYYKDDILDVLDNKQVGIRIHQAYHDMLMKESIQKRIEIEMNQSIKNLCNDLRVICEGKNKILDYPRTRPWKELRENNVSKRSQTTKIQGYWIKSIREKRRVLCEKLSHKSFLERINTDIGNCSVPDIWEQGTIAKKFEVSFLDSVLFENSKRLESHSKNQFVNSLNLPMEFNYDTIELGRNADFEFAKKLVFDAILDFLSDY